MPGVGCRNGIDSPVDENPELGVFKPRGHFVLAKGFARGLVPACLALRRGRRNAGKNTGQSGNGNCGLRNCSADVHVSRPPLKDECTPEPRRNPRSVQPEPLMYFSHRHALCRADACEEPRPHRPSCGIPRIGHWANTLMLSIVHAVLIRSLPYPIRTVRCSSGSLPRIVRTKNALPPSLIILRCAKLELAALSQVFREGPQSCRPAPRLLHQSNRILPELHLQAALPYP